MKRTYWIWIVALMAAMVAGSVLAFKAVYRQHGSQAAAGPVATRSAQAPSAPVQQAPPHPVGAIIIGQGPNLTVIRPLSAGQDDFSYLHISLSGKGEMLFKDSESRLVGFDSKAGKLLNQIANSNYDEGDQIDDDDAPIPGAAAPSPTPEPVAPSGLADNAFRRLEVAQPAPGTYLLTITTEPRRSDTKYSLDISFTSRSQKMSSAAFADVAAPPGTVHIYRLQIPSDNGGEIKAELVSDGQH